MIYLCGVTHDMQCLKEDNTQKALDFYEYVKTNVLNAIDVLLNNTEAIIIKKYYIENKTQKEIANEINSSQQYVSKVIKNGLQKLKIYFNKKR